MNVQNAQMIRDVKTTGDYLYILVETGFISYCICSRLSEQDFRPPSDLSIAEQCVRNPKLSNLPNHGILSSSLSFSEDIDRNFHTTLTILMA